MVNVRGGADTLATTGAGIKFVDGSEAGGHFITTAPLNMPTEAVLAGVLIRGPPHLYPPGWQLQITTAFPPLSGAGRDFAESVRRFFCVGCPPQTRI